MIEEPLLTSKNFWDHPVVREMTPKGKLCIAYAISCRDNNQPIIPEDMALKTGVEMSECQGWISRSYKNRILVEISQ